MSDSVRPHRRQPTRLPRPWDSPGKNTGVVCHFLLQCRKVTNESEVAQSCPTLSDPIDCSLPGSSIHPQFKSINSSVLSFLHSPTLTSIHDHWKNCSLDLKRVSRGLSRVEAGNPGFPRLVQVTSGGFSWWL